jgi:DNA uptake protein ComE-like DNA-binding protein
MSAAEELLCSRKWRLTHSLWMILGWVPMALTAWVGYLIIGIRAKNWKWILISVALFAWLVVWFTWMSTLPTIAKGQPIPKEYSASFGWSGLSSVIVWLGNAIGLQWLINRKWLVWRAHHEKAAPWYATATGTQQGFSAPRGTSAGTTIDQALGTVQPSIPAAAYTSRQSAPAPLPPDAPPSSPPVFRPVLAAQPSAVARLDLNDATRDQLATLLGFDHATVDQVVAARQRLGGFKDPSELVSFGGVKPHVFAAIQARITVERQASQPAPATPKTNPNPEPGGRRLDF